MQLIPVIDLLDGHAVRAVRGERDSYRPIRSSLAATSEPVAIGRALVAASGAQTLYVADLGAILQRGAHAATLAALLAALPGVAIWIDAGFASHAAMLAYFDAIARALPASSSAVDTSAIIQPASSASSPASSSASDAARLRTRIVPVFGTESLTDPTALREAGHAGFAPILSLDRRAGRLLAADALARDDDPAQWPQRVISMTLDHVGSYAGPDVATLAQLRERAPRGTQLIGAGGIRDRDDLRLARQSGAHAWLVASALHDRRLDEPAAAQP
ncbi:HisA/HisF-related TIM barrel protein [Paraburkholderia caballeronis]|uniref:HisA/HisF-related TIM barrel protein n=1 Tax=Paraburkholderia caballeronis TaxID=416943 RepID=UPI001064BAB5|nr:HisA/HisF-related TIM barrel protein [Paraburkholderia caballeronis]TDV19526.1 phosphoribosylformimino-5-aminoimidazole carboxamide ribotide isomerase [Paraburkholderia caballeronis]TDV22126.1 phosphoribosylformimino-5-aminoimidazole carboxamide ribotide isomerase [Paraburkholderia caballeronis]TDV29030.1 phosphoribosylformimino-5-aminoimidazole carboxamide ribotide isomerase [Paraburkholderia caballeronis]